MTASASARVFGGKFASPRERGERPRLRRSQRAQIEEFFSRHLRAPFASSELHSWFGSSFRTRVSEINRSPSARIRILNETAVSRNSLGQRCERSSYWSELKEVSEPTSPDFRAVKITWPATPEQTQAAGYEYMIGGKCKWCGEEFLWYFTPAGKKMPLSMIEGLRLVPHWKVCRNAQQFHEANAKTRAARASPHPEQPALFAL